MKITAKKQVSSTATNQSVNLGYSQSRENLVKKSEDRAEKFFDRRKGDRRKSVKVRKHISFGQNILVQHLNICEEKKSLKGPITSPKETTQAYQKTTETHAKWCFPTHLTLKEV